MPELCDSEFKLYVENGADNYELAAYFRKLNWGMTIDQSDKSSQSTGKHKTLEDCGLRTYTFSGDGVFVDDALMSLIISNSMSGIHNYRIEIGIETYTGGFLITSLDMPGDHTDALKFSLNMTGSKKILYSNLVIPENLALWYDASDLGTVTLSGDDVIQWDNKGSEPGHNLFSQTAFHPKQELSFFNDLAVLKHEGATGSSYRLSSDEDDYQRAEEGVWSLVYFINPMTGVSTTRYLSTDDIYNIMEVVQSHVNHTVYYNGATNNGYTGLQANAVTPDVLNAIIFTYQYNKALDFVKLFVNGAEIYSGAYGPGGFESDGVIDIVSTNASPTWPNTYFGEAMISPDGSDAQLASMQSYLSSKWDIAIA